MGFRRISISILSVCYYLRASIVSGSNAKAYLYYENAQCDGTNIEGEFVIAFDDESFSGYGYTDSYSGECLYLTGGYWEVDLSYYTNAYESIETGSCVQCNGQVGCSSDGTCDYFMSTVPQTSYQMAQNGDDGDLETETDDGAYAMAAQMQQSTIKTLESSRTYSSSARYVMVGAFIGCVALFGLLATLEGLRFLRQSKRSRVDVNSLPLTAGETTHNDVA